MSALSCRLQDLTRSGRLCLLAVLFCMVGSCADVDPHPFCKDAVSEKACAELDRLPFDYVYAPTSGSDDYYYCDSTNENCFGPQMMSMDNCDAAICRLLKREPLDFVRSGTYAVDVRCAPEDWCFRLLLDQRFDVAAIVFQPATEGGTERVWVSTGNKNLPLNLGEDGG